MPALDTVQRRQGDDAPLGKVFPIGALDKAKNATDCIKGEPS